MPNPPAIDVFFARNSRREKPDVADRLVPRRNFDTANATETFQARDLDVLGSTPECPARRGYHHLLKQNLAQPSRSLNFFNPRKNQAASCNNVESGFPAAPPRRLKNIFEEKALHAPEVLHRQRATLLDWSVTNLVAVALNGEVYIMSAREGSDMGVKKLDCIPDGTHVTSLAFACDGVHLAVGLSSGWTQLFNTEDNQKIRSIKDAHNVKVGAVSWNEATLTTGYKDGTMVHSDTRVLDHVVNKFKGHSGAINGLSWSGDLQCLASGGADSTVKIWEMAKTQPLQELKGHKGATKAIAWSPHCPTNLLTGSLDETYLYSWNASTGKMLQKVNTKFPVSSIEWCPFQKEFLAAHCSGTGSIYGWSYPSMKMTTKWTGHTKPVIDTALSPDGKRMLSISSDCTVRVWKAFKEEAVDEPMGEPHDGFRRHCTIR
ncbi:hypothetical protein BSKO_04046 [Bryopsis sp. KO-2023]|nr:hypothetical protein BSKO_04046 [Bryopsis sp. KO-2023]